MEAIFCLPRQHRPACLLVILSEDPQDENLLKLARKMFRFLTRSEMQNLLIDTLADHVILGGVQRHDGQGMRTIGGIMFRKANLLMRDKFRIRKAQRALDELLMIGRLHLGDI